MSIKRNIIANYLGQAWTAAVSLAFVPLYIKYLGMEAYGLIGVFAMLQTWLSLLDFGLISTLTRETARPITDTNDASRIWNLLRSVELSVGVVAAFIAVVLYLGSSWIASSWLQAENLPQSTVARACSLMGIVTALRFLENIYRGSIIGFQRQVTLNVLTAALATLRGVGAVLLLVWVSTSIEAFFLWQVAMSLLTTGLLAATVYRAMPFHTGQPKFSWRSLRSVGKFSAGSFGISVLGFLLSQTDKLVLSKMLTLAEFGYYTLAATLATYVRLLAASIDQAVYPKFVELLASRRFDDLAAYYHRSTQLSVVLMGGVGVSLGLFGKHFLFAWTHDLIVAQNTYPLLWLLLIGMVSNGLLNGPYYLQMAAGWTSMLFKMNTVMVLLFVPILLLCVVNFGAVGAAITWAALNLVYIVTIVTLMHRRLLPGEKWRWYIEDIIIPLGCAFIFGLALRTVLPPHLAPMPSALAFMAGCIVALFAAAMAAPYTRQTTTRLVSWALTHA